MEIPGYKVVDFIGYIARKLGEIIDLKPKEIQLLKMLLRYKSQVLSREQILDSIWNMNERMKIYYKDFQHELWAYRSIQRLPTQSYYKQQEPERN